MVLDSAVLNQRANQLQDVLPHFSIFLNKYILQNSFALLLESFGDEGQVVLVDGGDILEVLVEVLVVTHSRLVAHLDVDFKEVADFFGGLLIS